MDACWANALGGCTGGISGEHIVTESLWSGASVGVEGLPWCREGYKVIGKASNTANILCRQHNSNLSPVDDAGALAFSALRSVAEIHSLRAAMLQRRVFGGRFDDVVHHINGLMLERWLLKTLVNFEHAGKQGLPIGACVKSERVQPELVQVAFGRRSFEGKAGLYFAAFEQETLNMQERIQYTSWVKEELGRTFVGAGAFIFYGFRFFLCLEPVGFPEAVQIQRQDMHLMHRIRTVNIEIDKKPSQRIEFSW